MIGLAVSVLVIGAAVALALGDSGGQDDTGEDPASSAKITAGGQSQAFAGVKAVLARSAYTKPFQACILRELRRQGAGGRLSVIQDQPAPARERQILVLITDVEPLCAHPGETIVDASATPAKIALVRTRLAASFRAVLRTRPDLSRDFEACALTQINRMSDAKVVQMANGVSSQQHKIFAQLLTPCTSVE